MNGNVDDDDFKVWASRAPTSPNQLGLEGVTLKKGPQVCKTAALARYGSAETGEVKKTELRFRSAKRDSSGGFDFETLIVGHARTPRSESSRRSSTSTSNLAATVS